MAAADEEERRLHRQPDDVQSALGCFRGALAKPRRAR